MKTHDRSGRRFATKRVPVRENFRANRGDVEMLTALHYHGPLVRPALAKFRDMSEWTTRKRLRLLFDETGEDGGPYVDREWQTRIDPDTLCQRARFPYYRLTVYAKKLLKREGLWRDDAQSINHHHDEHDYIVSAVTSSLELGARQEGLTYIQHHEIVERLERRYFPIEVKGKTHRLTPDAFCGLRYSDGSARIFLIEVDRGTERNTTRVTKGKIPKNHHDTLTMYRKLLVEGEYKKYFPQGARVMLLSVFTNANIMANVMQLGVNGPFLFKSWTEWGIDFVPQPPKLDLLTEPWLWPGKEPFHINRV